MLTDSDKERFDDIMKRTSECRGQRDSIPERDEEFVAQTIRKWEDRAAEEHRLLREAHGLVDTTKQIAASRSENLKKFPQMSGWKRKFKRA